MRREAVGSLSRYASAEGYSSVVSRDVAVVVGTLMDTGRSCHQSSNIFHLPRARHEHYYYDKRKQRPKRQMEIELPKCDNAAKHNTATNSASIDTAPSSSFKPRDTEMKRNQWPNHALQRTPGFGVQLPRAAVVRPAQSRAVLPAMKPGTARAFASRRRAHRRAPGPESLSLGTS